MIRKIKKSLQTLQEAWRVSRAPRNESIFQFLQCFSDHPMEERHGDGFNQYLKDYKAIGKIEIEKDWHQDLSSGEMRFFYSNSLFSKGCLRVKLCSQDRALIVFLPGYRASAVDVLDRENHSQNMVVFAKSISMGLACWDWPLQGSRLRQSLYLNLKSVYSAEREYNRILPSLGTSLWREFVSELQFALMHLRRCVGSLDIYVVGWSMGGCFSYLAPLIDPSVKKVIAAGSCASIRHLLREGRTRLHGYFFYPLKVLSYFDLENIVEKIILQKIPLLIIHGDQDAGCLELTRSSILEKIDPDESCLCFEVLESHGHTFSRKIKSKIRLFLEDSSGFGQKRVDKCEKVMVHSS